MHRPNWDNLRFVLAVAENGSLSAAARALGVTHATVMRRIAEFESHHGGEIFDKTARGYSVPLGRSGLIDAARDVESAVLTVERMAKGLKMPLHGVVTVTSTDTFCHAVLPSILLDLRRKSNELQLELICSNSHLDLSRMHADITVRPANELPNEFYGTVAAQLGFEVYGPTLGATDWLEMKGALARSAPGKWLASQGIGELVAGGADSFLTLREMAAMGLGRTVLPCILGDADPRLRRYQDVMPDISVNVWVASHVDLAKVPRISAVRDCLTKALALQSTYLLGKDDSAATD